MTDHEKCTSAVGRLYTIGVHMRKFNCTKELMGFSEHRYVHGQDSFNNINMNVFRENMTQHNNINSKGENIYPTKFAIQTNDLRLIWVLNLNDSRIVLNSQLAIANTTQVPINQ